MNQKFGYYFKQGAKASTGTFRRFSNFVKYDILFILSIFSILIPPLALTIGAARAKQQHEEREIGVLSSMSALNDGKNFGRLFCIAIAVLLFFLTAIAFGAFILYLIYYMTLPFCTTIAQIELSIYLPLFIILILILLFFQYTLAPLGYIAYNHPELKAMDAIRLSFKLMKKGGKLKLFIFNLLSGIAELLFFLLAFGVIYGIGTNARILVEARIILTPILVFVFVIAYLFYHPFINTIRAVGLYALYEDMLSDEYHPSSITGFTIEKIKHYENYKKEKIDKKNVNQRIDDLYENSNQFRSIPQVDEDEIMNLEPLEKEISAVEDTTDIYSKNTLDEVVAQQPDVEPVVEAQVENSATEILEAEEAIEEEIEEDADEFEKYIQNLSSKEEGTQQ